MAERWRLVVRDGAKVRRSQWDSLKRALEQLQAETAAAATRTPSAAVDLKIREFQPEDLVAMRVQLKGPQRFVPKVRCGMDVRGDGSLLPWIGGAGRKQVECKGKETAWQALRRELGVR
ncbi:MAG: hypothetical protein F2799_01980 [Actinobacteria bacterium]|uniref:Unannotated protein n=1 Tax=freshwater metagenome TaxID=449393 RepID=A0A6J7D7F2_9ZZZZ|nr:hypothetical protein [Actinomycetota bacterium]